MATTAGKKESIESIDSKVNKTDYIKEAFAKLGIETPAQEIAKYILTNKNVTIKPQYIYLIKSKMINPNKKPASKKLAKDVAAFSKPRKQSVSTVKSAGNQFTETYAAIQSLIKAFGNKTELVKAINAI